MSTLWNKAIEDADAARLLLDHELYNNACSRAYYAMFTAARAILEERGGISLEALKRHATVLQMFSLHFIKNGPLGGETGALLARPSRLRGIADYDDAPVGADQARQAITMMEQFLSEVAKLRKPAEGHP